MSASGFSPFEQSEDKAMKLEYQDIADLEPVNATRTYFEAGGRASEGGSGWPGWMRVYSRTVGFIQWGYALVVGRYAVELLRFCYHPEFGFKGGHEEAYLSLAELFYGTVFALLSLSGFIGGCGLLALKRWARPWEIAYLSVLSVGVAAVTCAMAFDIRSGARDFMVLALFSLAFALPYMPFLFAVVDGGTGPTRCRPPEEKTPIRGYGGVSDRALDF
jgi:hypothetical protein